MSRIFVFLAFSVFMIVFNAPLNSHAFLIDTNLFYFADDLPDSDSRVERYAGDASIVLGLDQDNMFNIGVNATTLSSTDTLPTAETTWSTLDYGFKIVAFLNRVKTWGLGLSYNLVANGTFKDTAETKRRGSSVKFDIGYTPMIYNGIYFGVRLSYYLAMYNEVSTDGGSSYQSSSYSRSFIYPSVFMSFRFK